MRPSISIRSVSKEFVLGERGGRYFTLRESLGRALSLGRGRKARAPGADRLWALKDVSFDVEEGEVVGIIGHNGAGKSTLLKILSRITEPTEGEIEIYGRVSSLLEVGTGFHPELTGRENVYLNGSILGMRKREIDAKFDEIVAFSGVERFLDTPVKRYSSGMQVRLAFAVAAHLEPEVLLVDEVLAVGDAEFQRKCLGKMSEVARGGRTVLFVSHNMAAVARLCQRAVLLDRGMLSEIGEAGTIVDSYLSRVTYAESRTERERLSQDSKSGIAILDLKTSREHDDLLLSMSLDIAVDAPRIGLGLNVLGQEGSLVSKLRPYKTKFAFDNVGSLIEVSVRFGDFFRLMTAGSYTFDIWFTEPSTRLIRGITSAIRVEVPFNDRFLSGHALLQSEDGFIAFDARLEARAQSPLEAGTFPPKTAAI